MSPYEDICSAVCSSCGKIVIRHDSNVTASGMPHMCNSVGYYTVKQEKDTRVKHTFKNSEFFNKHKFRGYKHGK